MKNDRVMPINVQAEKWNVWPILGLKLAVLAMFFKISTSNLFCPVHTFRLIGEPN